MASFDSNTWYNIIYSFQEYALSAGSGSDVGWVIALGANYSDPLQQWQVMQINSTSYYAIRNRETGPGWLLMTQPCVASNCLSNRYAALKAVDKMESLQDIYEWLLLAGTGGTTRIASRGNGTSAYLDALDDGSTVGLNTSISSPALEWTFASIGMINDPTFSTALPSQSTPFSSTQASPPTTTLSSATSTISPPAGVTLTSGAKAGIGIGIAVVVLAALVVAIILVRRRWHTRLATWQQQPHNELGVNNRIHQEYKSELDGSLWRTVYPRTPRKPSDAPRKEMDGDSKTLRYELETHE